MKKCRGAGRPRCFEAEQVLDSASALFWEKGYSATSVSDLAQATGLNKGSLYSSFGDKHTLFLKCLRRYLDQQISCLATTIDTDEPIAALEKTFQLLAFPSIPNKPCGCLAINTLTELAPHDCEVKKLLDNHLQEIERQVIGCIEHNEMPCALPSEQAARVFCSLALATRARSRSGEPDLLDQNLAQTVLELLYPSTK